MRDQKALTIVTRIRSDESHLKELSLLLDAIGEDIEESQAKDRPAHYIRFEEISTTCFASWIILDRDPHYPPALVFECNYEGPPEVDLNELVKKAGETLHGIYRHCEGYPSTKLDRPALRRYLKEHSEPHLAFFVGCPYQSHKGILTAIETRDVIEKFLGQEPLLKDRSSNKRSPMELRAAIEQHLQRRIDAGKLDPIDGLITPLGRIRALRRRNEWMFRLSAAVVLISLALFAWKWLIGGVVVLLAGIAPFLIQERREAKDLNRGTGRVDPRLFRSEDRFLQNHLTTLVDIKPGWYRLTALKLSLRLVNFLAKYRYITGDLGGIPSIHFARWVIIDKDKPIKRLLFISNFDGSWHSYLGDFVDKGWFGLNGVWGHTGGYPPTRFLLWGGAKHVVEFKDWSREHNLYAPVWYGAYKNVGVSMILDAIRIAEKIGEPLSEKETKEWLRQL
jgi:hypothetical protein